MAFRVESRTTGFTHPPTATATIGKVVKGKMNRNRLYWFDFDPQTKKRIFLGWANVSIDLYNSLTKDVSGWTQSENFEDSEDESEDFKTKYPPIKVENEDLSDVENI